MWEAVSGTQLGKVEDVARIPEEWRLLKMVMIPKPGKDHKRVKGWRPIVFFFFLNH